MLILSRKLNESIVIDGRIIVKVLRIDKDTVKLGIQAPAELPVHRHVYRRLLEGERCVLACASDGSVVSLLGDIASQRPRDTS